MKSFVFISLMLLFVTALQAQELNRIITDEKIQREVLYGACDAQGFLNPVFGEAYITAFEAYHPDESALDALRHHECLATMEVVVVFASWCGDSRREMPHFMKLMQMLEVPDAHIKLFATNRDKTCGIQQVDALGTEFVPTFFIYVDGHLVGSIVEFPLQSLEQDMLDMLVEYSYGSSTK